MGVRHVVLFRFTPETPADQPAAIARELRALPAAIPEIVAYTAGADAGLNEGTWDFAVVADFAGVADYMTYRDHPVHRQVIAEHIQPFVAERAAAQIETD